MSVMSQSDRYGIEEMAALGGVTRRTVRYYVQEGLLQPPLGVGRGRHYGPEHLARLQAVKAFQEQGLSLDEIRRTLERGDGTPGHPTRAARRTAGPASFVPRSAWVRLEVVPGVELHVSGRRRLPPPGRLRELAEWCERHFRRSDDE
jgi:DNA-binding transcriptional MerR regulator